MEHLLVYPLYDISDWASDSTNSENLNGIIIANARDGCTFADLRLQLELKKVEKVSTTSSEVVEVTPGSGE